MIARLIAPVAYEGIYDSIASGYTDRLLHDIMLDSPGGVIAGYGLYKLLSITREALTDRGEWSFYIQGKKRNVKVGKKERRIDGPHYVERVSYRSPLLRSTNGEWEKDSSKGGQKRKRYRPPTVKWIIWNLELFMPGCHPVQAGERLLRICERRGIDPRSTPGALGSAMLRASSEWKKDRKPAPFFISDIARKHLPGNYYEHKPSFLKAKRVTLFDQAAAHHNIVNSIPLPDPNSIRRRGINMNTINSDPTRWKRVPRIIAGHWGLLHARIECDTIPREVSHLYPRWARDKGTYWRMIWTPELRLLDNRVRLLGISSAFTGYKPDVALLEYSDFALGEIEKDPNPVVKAALHAAYGSLAAQTRENYEIVIAGRDEQSPRSNKIKLPLFGDAESFVIPRGKRHPILQNAISYGVIQAEQTTRSIEFGRSLEAEGYPVLQVYADAVLAGVAQLPFTPNGWMAKHLLDDLVAGAPNQIISSTVQRLPGIHGQRRRALVLKRVLS
jgi:hypothetical protein